MKKNTGMMVAPVAVLVLLAACGSDAPSENNQNLALGDGSMPAQSKMADMANDPNNPYARAEMQMHERMMAAQGANASETWVKKMIQHHRGAIEMSNALIGLGGGDTPALALARKIVSDQGADIQKLERMLQAGGIGAGTSGDADPYKRSDQTMHESMMAATGTNPSETWVRKMIEHHRGAVDMSNILIAQGGDPRVVQEARMTAQKQQKEIAELESMLAGGDATSTVPPAATRQPAAEVEPRRAASAPKAKAEAPRTAPAAEPRVAPKTEPKASPKAPAPATPTCAPEHRALGHC